MTLEQHGGRAVEREPSNACFVRGVQHPRLARVAHRALSPAAAHRSLKRANHPIGAILTRMRTRSHPLAGVLAAVLTASAAHAETGSVTANGFTSTHRDEVKAGPDQVWKAIAELPRWWSDQHTWSGKASNMTLEPRAGGCWCENWDGGQSVQHGQVLLAQPGRVIRLAAALGPLQELPVQGVLTIVTGVQEGKTVLRMSYRVGGPPDIGLDKLAPVVDQVIGQQFRRLKSLVETGRPD